MKSAILALFFIGQIQATFVYIAGYEPESNVYNHSKIDLDVADIMTYVGSADWTSAKNIYENGKHSIKSSGVVRNFKAFSVNGCKLKGEKYFDIYNSYWVSKGLTDCQYADDIMKAAFDGTAVASTGFSFSGSSTGTDAFRSQAIKKGVLYLNVFMYTIWEMQDAINDCIAGDLTTNTGAVHAWDEAVAFYTGSAEGTERGGINGLDSGSKYMMFTLAEKRCKNFGTCTADYDANPIAGYSEVNNAIFTEFERMKSYLKPNSQSANFKCENVNIGKDKIVKKMLVPMLQGVFRYLYETDSRIEPNGASDKELGELWAFVTGVLPMIHQADASVAADLYTYTWGKDRSQDNFASLKTKIESTFDALGVTCEDIGTICDKSITTSCTPYTDGEVSFDTSACTNSASKSDNDNDTINIAIIVVCIILALLLIAAIFYAFSQRNKYHEFELKKLNEENGGSNITPDN